MGDKEFNLAAFRLTPEAIAEIDEARKRAPPKRSRKAKPGTFVMLPYEQTLAAAGRLRDAPMAVLVELAYQEFKMHKNPVLLSNAGLRTVGVSHDAKVRALRRLEAAGLIRADWRGGKKAPLVTLLWK